MQHADSYTLHESAGLPSVWLYLIPALPDIPPLYHYQVPPSHSTPPARCSSIAPPARPTPPISTTLIPGWNGMRSSSHTNSGPTDRPTRFVAGRKSVERDLFLVEKIAPYYAAAAAAAARFGAASLGSDCGPLMFLSSLIA